MDDISIILNTLSYVISIMIANRDALDKIKKMSLSDQLTGVNNRHALNLMEESSSSLDGEVALMMCDINGLKSMNDTKGHIFGDKLIINTANALTKVFSKDNVYRVGGDEFVVILSNNTEEEFNHKLKELKSDLEHLDIRLAIGYVNYRNKKVNIQQMMKEADAQMYKDKKRFYSQYENDRRTKSAICKN